MSEIVGVQIRPSLREQHPHVPLPLHITTNPIPRTGRRGLGHVHQIQIGIEKFGVSGQESKQSIPRRRPWPQRRHPRPERLLQGPFPGVQQRDTQPGLVTEPAEQGALAHPGLGGDLVHGHPVDPTLGEQPGGHFEDLGPVAHGIRTFLTRLGRNFLAHGVRTLVRMG